MSQRLITRYFSSLLSGGENRDTTPTAVSQREKELSSAHDSQSGVSLVIDGTPGSDRTVNHDLSSPEDDSRIMATQTQHDTTNNISHSENISILDRSLTEMLVSAFEDETRPSVDPVSDIESGLAEQVVMLESQLIHVTMRLDRKREEKTSMHNQIELMQSEFELYKKRSDKQKQQIRN